MPVLLHQEDWDRWLTADWKEARLLAHPFPSQLMINEPVGMPAKASRAGAQTGTVSE
jgi:putative SOS response-associated peptidase YedK